MRKRVDLRGTLRLPDGTEVEVHVTDMSPGGAFVELEERPAYGAKVHLTIGLPGGDVAVGGTICWTKVEGVGVQFGLLGAKQTYAITEHLADLAPMSSDLSD